MPSARRFKSKSRLGKRAGGGSDGAGIKARPSRSDSSFDESSASRSINLVGSFPVVAIGASAGGLEAYTEFFHALPPDLGMAFVLIQHLDPSHHSLLAEIVAKSSRMPVDEVRSGMRIRPNRVFVIPPNSQMTISQSTFTLSPRSKEAGQHLTVNCFMRSLAEEAQSRAIGIVLSGTGGDGTLGLEDIKAEGGITFAQSPGSAKYDGMPRSAVSSGVVDFVLSPNEIAKELQRISRHPYVSEARRTQRKGKAGTAHKEDLSGIIQQLRKTSGVDFASYRPNTIQRRALRRMVLLKLDSLDEYAKYLKAHSEETEKLYDDVLIPVTSFFRDLEAFEALKTKVYPIIVKEKANKGTIRMWAPGCSTGQETYSLAMTLLEFLGDRASSYQVQIFGTDLNEKGIQRARSGVYGESLAEEISAERLRRFFVKVDEGYRINKAVRDMCVFARQNLANDPPFSQMNVVACRNLLIYLSPALQRKIVPILHYALKHSGFLVLGKSEGISGFHNLFSQVDAKYKIYAKKQIASRLHYDFSQTHYPAGSGADLPAKTTHYHGPTQPEFDVQVEADRLVLKNYAPVGVVINDSMEVVQFRGRTTPYLEPAPGKPSLNVLKLARNGLAMELRTLINTARTKGVPARKDGVLFEDNGYKKIVNISVAPLEEKHVPKQERHCLILFDDVSSHSLSAPKASLRGARIEKNREVKRLTRELDDAQDAIRAAVESEDALKEEFQSANEEILSANEELQSTNEELETSKEELQSANEELHTLNDELHHKNAELHDLNNDLSNFLNSTQMPVVMLDRRFRIRRFTPRADSLLKVVPSDIGRAISDIRLNIKLSDLETMMTKVLDSLQPAKREVQDFEDRWHSLHIFPYRTQDNKIDGVTLALVDIDAVKRANEQLQRSTEFFRAIIDTVREPLLVLDSTLRIVAVNQSFLRTFQTSSEQTVGHFLYRIGGEQWNIPKLRALLEEVLPKEQLVTDFEVPHKFETIGEKTMLLNARTVVPTNNAEPMILLAIEDVTERKLAEVALIKSEKLAASGRLAASLAHEINNPLQAVTNLMVLLGQSPRLDLKEQEYATLASKELFRVVHLVRQSLGLYREAASPSAVDLQEVLESVLNLYARQIEAKGIKVIKKFELVGTLQSYPGEIRQMLSTLLVNAMEACSEGCRIALRARESVDWGKNPPVRGVRITLADNGSGIAANSIARIFDPFFTTKGERGTGLGLWVVRGIVHRLGGSIRVRSSTRLGNSGTSFSIFLYRAPKGNPKQFGAFS